MISKELKAIEDSQINDFNWLELKGLISLLRDETERLKFKMDDFDFDRICKSLHNSLEKNKTIENLSFSALNALESLNESGIKCKNISAILERMTKKFSDEIRASYSLKVSTQRKKIWQVLSCKFSPHFFMYEITATDNEADLSDDNQVKYTFLCETKIPVGPLCEFQIKDMANDKGMSFYFIEEWKFETKLFKQRVDSLAIDGLWEKIVLNNFDSHKVIQTLDSSQVDFMRRNWNARSIITFPLYLKYFANSTFKIFKKYEKIDGDLRFTKNYPISRMFYLKRNFGQVSLTKRQKDILFDKFGNLADFEDASIYEVRCQNSGEFILRSETVSKEAIAQSEKISRIIPNDKDYLINFKDMWMTNGTKNLADILQRIFISTNAKTNLKIEIEGKQIFNPLYKANVVFGQAGTGKSTLVKSIVKKYRSNFTSVKIFTPTHKAAWVYKEVIETGLATSSTIQSGSWNVCDGDLLIFDEISMYESKNWEKILSVCEKNTKIFIGDPEQLQAIGEYSFVKEIKDSLLDYPFATELTKLWRYANEELKTFNKNSYKNKQIFLSQNSLTNYFNNIDDLYDKIGEVRNDFTKRLSDLRISDENIDEKPVVITSKNYGVIGTKLLSKFFGNDPHDFKSGDKVIFMRNYVQIDQSRFIHNNDIKEIKTIQNRIKTGTKDVVEFFVEFTTGEKISFEENKTPIGHINFLTCHRGQGTTFNAVIVVIDENQVDFEWFYSAISRASHYLSILLPKDFDEDSIIYNAPNKKTIEFLKESFSK